MSTTEEDLEPSVAGEVVEGLTATNEDSDGPSTAEIDALDESLVESLGEYAAEDATGPGDSNDGGSVDVVSDVEVADEAPASDADDALLATFASNDDDDSGAMSWDFEGEALSGDVLDVDDETSDVPEIVMATDVDTDDADIEAAAPTVTDTTIDVPDAVAADVDAKDGDIELPEVSDDILEELRRADIDGPVVDAAPQDDTTSAKRRPRKPVDYDPAPVPVPLKVPRILGRKARVRKVTRVVRHVDPWSVFKIAIIANLVLYLILLTAGVLLWNVAYATGTIENVERFFESFGWQSFEFEGGEIYHAGWIAGLFGVLGLTGLAVLVATLFNLITDLVGGVRFTVLEEEVVESRSSPMRRFVVRRPEPEIPAVLDDGSGPIIREAVVDDTGGIER